MPLRYGIIGTGMMGQEHIRNLALIDGAEVAAIADPDEGMRARGADLTGARAFPDYRDLLSRGLCDAFVIATPNDTHAAVMRDVMAAGKPILCEKPLATNSADARAMLNAATAPVWVAMEYRYLGAFQGLSAELDRGTAGDPVMMAIREHRFPFLPKVGDWNRFSARTGGTLVEKCCHFWDLMRLTLKSDPVRVFASAAMDANHRDERYDGRVPDIIDNAFVVVDFANGTRGMLDLCMFAEGSEWQELISVTGPRARIDACIPGPARFAAAGTTRHSQLVVSDRASQRVTTTAIEEDETVLGAGDHHGSTFRQHQRFFAMVREGRDDPEVTLSDGLWAVLVGEAAEKSAVTHAAVEVTPP